MVDEYVYFIVYFEVVELNCESLNFMFSTDAICIS